ncbi:hypothetical protein F4680DRAFT_464659 [Xylaria scruposa]|nr:hypothetical protein F4680DRAFT_464659 [Xylaria scruposa]
MEGFSIFVAVLGITNGLQTLVTNAFSHARELQHYARLLDNRLDDLSMQSREFSHWKDRWIIWASDDRLLDHFWGNTKDPEPNRGDIEKTVRRIRQILEIIEKLIEEIKLSNNLVKRYAKKGILVVTGKRGEIDKQLNEFKKAFEILKFQADDAYKRKQRFDILQSDQPVANKDIYDTAYKHWMRRLAWETDGTSRDLYNNCLRSVDHLQLHLELDFFRHDIKKSDISPTGDSTEQPQLSSLIPKRVIPIATSALDPALRYTFNGKDVVENYQMRIRATKTAETQESGDEFYTLHTIVRMQPNTRRKLRVKNGGDLAIVQFLMSEPVARLEPLLDILSRPPPEDLDKRQLMIFRMTRLHHLAEFGMLSLRTPWMNRICSCRVAEAGSGYCLQVLPQNGGNPQHVCPDIRGGTRSIRGILQERSPLFFLGLLFIEVILHVLIKRVTVTGNGMLIRSDKIELVYEDNNNDIPINGVATLQDLKNRFEHDECYNAVKTCIESTWTNKAGEEDLTTYFTKIVYP